MKLLSTAVSMGIGYLLASPEVRQKLVELTRHPRVKQLRTQGQDLAADGVRTAKHRLRGSGGTDTSTSTSSAQVDPALTDGVLPPAEGAGGAPASVVGGTGLPPRPAPQPPAGTS